MFRKYFALMLALCLALGCAVSAGAETVSEEDLIGIWYNYQDNPVVEGSFSARFLIFEADHSFINMTYTHLRKDKTIDYLKDKNKKLSPGSWSLEGQTVNVIKNGKPDDINTYTFASANRLIVTDGTWRLEYHKLDKIANGMIPADQTPGVEFDDFTLNTDEEVDPGVKEEGQMLFQMIPNSVDAGGNTNINGAYAGVVDEEITPEIVRSIVAGNEEPYREEYQAIGFTMSGYTIEESTVISLGGKNACLCSMNYQLSMSGFSISLYQALIFVKNERNEAYMMTVTSRDPVLREKAIEYLDSIISWK